MGAGSIGTGAASSAVRGVVYQGTGLGSRGPGRYAPLMEFLVNLFLAFHIIGIAALLGGFFSQMKLLKTGEARITPGMLHGAYVMLVTGIVMVGLREADDADVNHVKIAVKLVLLVVLTALAYVNRDEEKVATPVFGVIGLLTTANIFIATLW
jgi:hypothetical protein